jgi:hypothetical protein
MSAIITDQFRILNAKNFLNSISSSEDCYYTFVGLPNPLDVLSTWDFDPPSHKDSFNDENICWETMMSLKKIDSTDVRLVIPKITWSSGRVYDYYRHDYTISNRPKISDSSSLYSSFFYVLNNDYRVYICLENGTNPENPKGKPSLDEPTFVDLEPRPAGSSNDGYIWKYLYTIKPSDIVKFESTDYIPVPSDWESNVENASIRNNAIDGAIKTIIIKNRGISIGSGNQIYKNVPIKGDGTGAECTIVTNSEKKVESITVTNQGSGYTFAIVDLNAGGITTFDSRPEFDVIIPPKGGHGFDIYRELGTYNVLIYSRLENDVQNPDFITGNQISRVGIVYNPRASNGSILSSDKASAVYALKLIGSSYNTAVFTPDSKITQTIGTGITASGRVISYDQNTGVLKYWQDRSLAGFNTDGTQQFNPVYGFNLNEFTSSITTGGSLVISGNTGGTLTIDSGFTGIDTTINNKKYYLGQTFTSGVSLPEVQKYSGSIIYVDNRPSITRSSNQKEDIKVILQF